MHSKVGRHLIFWWDLRPTMCQSMWMEGICWCRVVSTATWANITYKNLMLQACRIFFCYIGICLCLGGVPMSCPYVGAKFWSQCLSHMMPNLGGVLPLGQGDGCAQLDWIDLEKMLHILIAAWKNGKYMRNDLMWPSNFEGDILHLKFLTYIVV